MRLRGALVVALGFCLACGGLPEEEPAAEPFAVGLDEALSPEVPPAETAPAAPSKPAKPAATPASAAPVPRPKPAPAPRVVEPGPEPALASSATTAGATVLIGKAQLEGDIRADVVSKVAARHIAELRACYREGLGAAPGLKGVAMFAFDVDPQGRVSGTRVHSSALKHPATEACVAESLGRMSFPSGQAGRVVLPLTFKGG